MPRDFNQNRIANARLVNADIDKFGKTFAIQNPWNADGFSSVNVSVEQAPSDIKKYLEGDNSITIYPVPNNIDKLCNYALASFPNIEDLYLFKTSAIVVLEDDLSYLLDLNKIYVPTDLLSAYQSAYPTIASKFDIIVEDYTLTIPFVGDTTLTSEYVDSVIAMLSNAEKNAITKVVIPTDFSSSSANDIAWGYDFSALVNLNDNIWYGATQYDFSEYTIQDDTQDHILTASVVETKLANIRNDKLTLIEKIIVPIDFTSYSSGSITAIQNGLSNLRYLETTYEAGAMEIDFQDTEWQEIISRIQGLNKTLDEALVYARFVSYTHMQSFIRDENLVIMPPFEFGQNGYSYIFDTANKLVYMDDIRFTSNSLILTNCFSNMSALYKVKAMRIVNASSLNFELNFLNPSNLHELNMYFKQDFNASGGFGLYYQTTNVAKLILQNFKGGNIKLNWGTNMTEQDFIDLFNSLGTNTETKTITLKSTDFNKLRQSTIDIATNKNWTVA